MAAGSPEAETAPVRNAEMAVSTMPIPPPASTASAAATPPNRPAKIAATTAITACVLSSQTTVRAKPEASVTERPFFDLAESSDSSVDTAGNPRSASKTSGPTESRAAKPEDYTSLGLAAGQNWII